MIKFICLKEVEKVNMGRIIEICRQLNITQK